MAKKVVLYIATSLDGFIARENGSVDWLDQFNSSGEDYGYYKFFDSINTVIMGSSTYKQILGFGEYPYKCKNSFVFSKSLKDDENVKIINEDVMSFLKNIDSEENQKIWLCGGANLVNQFLKHNLIDEFIIFTMPIKLGSGIKLFDKPISELLLKIEESKSYASGVEEVHYIRA